MEYRMLRRRRRELGAKCRIIPASIEHDRIKALFSPGIGARRIGARADDCRPSFEREYRSIRKRPTGLDHEVRRKWRHKERTLRSACQNRYAVLERRYNRPIVRDLVSPWRFRDRQTR